MSRRVPTNVTRWVLPGPMLWFAVLATGALAVLLIVVAVALIADPEVPWWGVLIAALAGASAGAVSSMLLVMGALRPRPSGARLLEASERSGGLRIDSSRRGDRAAAVAIGFLVATFAVGALVADGGWSIALGLLAAMVALAGVGAVTALTRPRYLQITPEGLESAALRSHTTATWDALQYASISIASGGGGQMLARLTLPRDTPGYQETWRNRLELRRTAVDIEYAMAYADPEALLRLVVALIENPALRTRVVEDRAALCEALADPTRPAPWRAPSSR